MTRHRASGSGTPSITVKLQQTTEYLHYNNYDNKTDVHKKWQLGRN